MMMTMQKAQTEYFAFMGNSCGVEPTPALRDIEQSIEECKAMLDSQFDWQEISLK